MRLISPSVLPMSFVHSPLAVDATVLDGSGVGGATRVVMRGAKSIEGDNNALYVVDGIPLFNTNMGNTDSGIMGEGKAGTEGIADFNPEDIESISILSGPSAAALYGSSAANGVVLHDDFDMIVAIANGGIVPAGIINQRLQKEVHLLRINLRSSTGPHSDA